MIRRRIRPSVLALVAFAALAVVTARPGDRSLYPAAKDTAATVYVINNGFHTDIAVPRAALAARGGPLAAAATAVPADPWMVIGWGDASFYTAKGISLARVGDGLRALFKPGNPSVIRIFGVSRDPALAYEPGVATPIHVREAGLERMLQRMEGSMSLAGTAPVRAAARTTPDEAFFDSVEHFSILRLCNHWTSDMLAAAGLPMTPAVDGLAPLLMTDRAWRSGVRASH
jgi:hypothetical protein